MDVHYFLLSYAPAIGFCLSLICCAIALRITCFQHKGCTDCGARLNMLDGTHCSTCTARKRAALQAQHDMAQAMTAPFTAPKETDQ